MKPALKHSEQTEDRSRKTSDAREATVVDIPQCFGSKLVQLMTHGIIIYRVCWACSRDVPLVSVREAVRVAVTTVRLHGNRLIAI